MGRATAGVRGMKLRSTERRCRELRPRPRRRACCCSCHRAVTESARRSPRSTARAAAARACGACGSPKRAARSSRRSPSTPATRSSCSRRRATSCAWASTRSPSRAGTRPACASPGSTRAIRLSPWPGCSRPSNDATAEGGEDVASVGDVPRGEETDRWRAPRPCSRAFPPSPSRARRSEAAPQARRLAAPGLRAALRADGPLGRPLVGAQGRDLLLPVRADRDARRRRDALVDRVGGRRRRQRRELRRRARQQQGLPLPVVGGAARRDAHRARRRVPARRSSPCSRPRSTTCSRSCSAASRSPSSSRKTVQLSPGTICGSSGAIAQSVRAHP